MHEERFTPEQVEIVQKEIDQLMLIWAQWQYTRRDTSATPSVHMPPALIAYNDFITECVASMALPETVDLGYLVGIVTGITFPFSQFCMNQGFLFANMTPCNCGEVTDEALTKLLEGQ